VGSLLASPRQPAKANRRRSGVSLRGKTKILTRPV
jgi:hypothetical protein